MGRWGRCRLLIDVDTVFFQKKLKVFFQNFSVINMKVQLKYFYSCIVIMHVIKPFFVEGPLKLYLFFYKKP